MKNKKDSVAKKVIGVTGLVVFKCIAICVAIPAIGAFVVVENILSALDPPNSRKH